MSSADLKRITLAMALAERKRRGSYTERAMDELIRLHAEHRRALARWWTAAGLRWHGENLVPTEAPDPAPGASIHDRVIRRCGRAVACDLLADVVHARESIAAFLRDQEAERFALAESRVA